MKTIYFDESGYTGSNVCDKGQPMFVYASVCLSDKELTSIKNIVPLSVGECHFKELRKIKDNAGDAVIFAILNHPCINKNTVKVLVADKIRNISAQIIQYIVEDVHAAKNDYILWGGRDRKMATDLQRFLDNYKNKDTVELLCKGFYMLFKQKSIEQNKGAELFYKAVDEMQTNCSDSAVNSIFCDLQEAKSYIAEIISDYDKFALDYTVTALHRLAYEWKIQNGVRLPAVVDDSKPIKDKLELLQRMVNAREMGSFYTGAVFMHPNLELSSIQLEDSKTCFGLQVADIVASAFCRVTRKDVEKTSFEDKLLWHIKDIPYYPMINN